MKVNRPTERQGLLFKIFKDFDFVSTGSARTHYGAAIEEVICAALNIYSIPINGNYEVNFDAFKGPQFYEIKSVKAGSKVVLYDWRLEKEKPYTKDLNYLFGVHRVTGAKSNRELWSQIAYKGLMIIEAPAKLIHDLAAKEPLRKIKHEKQSGFSRAGYCEGYRNLPLKSLADVGAGVSTPSILEIYDFRIKICHMKLHG